jgi:hypothetical protein
MSINTQIWKGHFQEGKIKDVYDENMKEELLKISDLVEEYNWIAMVIIILI